MGSLPPDTSPPISLAAQQGHLLRRYPHSRVVRRGERLIWSGTLTPAEYTATYELLIDHQIGKPPLVYVARPRLRLVDGQGLPHVYPLNTLCLFLGNREWHQSIPIADTLVPWASEWLLFYELWLATGGQWLGEGGHPPPGPMNRHARRRHSSEDASKLNPAHHGAPARIQTTHRSRRVAVQREADAKPPGDVTDIPAGSRHH